ncbi:MAG: alpha/beta fold hydrolase [Syntrophales bacterium]
MSEPIMISGKGDGVKLQLAEWGTTGQVVLCIHGITANCRCWDVVASSLEAEFRVLAMDLRGRGHSEKPATGYSVEQHCRDIAALQDDLGLKRPVIMGHSLGAFIALAFAATYPDRVESVILVDGGGDLSTEQMAKVFSGIKPALERLGKVFPSAEAYIDLMKQAPYLQPWSPALEAYCRYELTEVEGGVKANIDPLHIQEEAINLGKMKAASFYREIACKVLILRATRGLLAEDDILLPEEVVERMTREILTAKRIDIPGTNHYSILFQPNKLRDEAIKGFLREHSRF